MDWQRAMVEGLAAADGDGERPLGGDVDGLGMEDAASPDVLERQDA
jgi:hypothetical protein